jgi:hypothetical protein
VPGTAVPFSTGPICFGGGAVGVEVGTGVKTIIGGGTLFQQFTFCELTHCPSSIFESMLPPLSLHLSSESHCLAILIIVPSKSAGHDMGDDSITQHPLGMAEGTGAGVNLGSLVQLEPEVVKQSFALTLGSTLPPLHSEDFFHSRPYL